MMKRILLSLLILSATGALAFGVSRAFFSDTETSTGNQFTAGAIDLKIDNTSYYTDVNGVLVASTRGTTWDLRDLTVEKFFDFVDLKPGDIGEDTISVHVNNNNAWLCAAARVTVNSDETCTEPENTDENNLCVPETNGTNGELASQVNFAFWKDDGDNVLEDNETPFLSGPISGLNGVGQIALADSSVNAVLGANTPLPGDTTVNIGKAWCFGTLTPVPLPQLVDGTPLTRGTGFTCNGAAVNNAAQTDKVVGDLQFYAVQSRNNATFTCAANYTPTWPNGIQRPFIGALLSSYPAPSCNVTVNLSSSIQAAIDAASTGQTICLADGLHNSDSYPLRVNEDNMVLAGVNPPLASATLSGGVILDNDGAKVTGLIIGSSTLLGETFGVYVNTGVDNAEVSFNKIIGTSTAVGRGIVNATGTTTNGVYKHNVINTWLTGIFLNPSSGMLADYNTITGNGVGIANDNPTNNTLSHNVIKSNSIEGVGALLNGVESLNVNFNNLYSNGTSDDLNSYGATTVDAENNWWGDITPADNVTGLVDFTPFEASAFAEN